MMVDCLHLELLYQNFQNHNQQIKNFACNFGHI